MAALTRRPAAVDMDYSFKLGIRLVSFRYQREKKASFPDPDGSDGVAVARHRWRRTLLLTAHLGHSGGLRCRPRHREPQQVKVGARRPDDSIAGRVEVLCSPCAH